jgi:hypothetical protein
MPRAHHKRARSHTLRMLSVFSLARQVPAVRTATSFALSCQLFASTVVGRVPVLPYLALLFWLLEGSP